MRLIIKKARFIILLLLLQFPTLSYAVSGFCYGQFPNPLTDFCWDCVFPVKLMGAPIMAFGNQEDITTDAPNLCACAGPAGTSVPGLLTSFWEMNRIVEITKTPYCMVTLGTTMDMGINDGLTGADTGGNVRSGGRVSHQSYRQVHWYINPLWGLMGVMLDNKCLEAAAFDIAYMSELDPTHTDEELARIISPDSYLFSNIVATLACTPDCVAASVGFGIQSLYWCDGCNGSVYPMTGHVEAVYSGIQMSSLMVHRTAAKLHRMLTLRTTTGQAGMCGSGSFQITMDKTQYKYSLIYPIGQTSGNTASFPGNMTTLSANPSPSDVSSATSQSQQVQSSAFGRCCQPLGRTSILWGAGRENIMPQAQDFAYAIFHKRDCCALMSSGGP